MMGIEHFVHLFCYFLKSMLTLVEMDLRMGNHFDNRIDIYEGFKRLNNLQKDVFIHIPLINKSFQFDLCQVVVVTDVCICHRCFPRLLILDIDNLIFQFLSDLGVQFFDNVEDVLLFEEHFLDESGLVMFDNEESPQVPEKLFDELCESDQSVFCEFLVCPTSVEMELETDIQKEQLK